MCLRCCVHPYKVDCAAGLQPITRFIFANRKVLAAAAATVACAGVRRDRRDQKAYRHWSSAYLQPVVCHICHGARKSFRGAALAGRPQAGRRRWSTNWDQFIVSTFVTLTANLILFSLFFFSNFSQENRPVPEPGPNGMTYSKMYRPLQYAFKKYVDSLHVLLAYNM